MQVALDRAGFSPGEIDGQGGPKTRLALSAFQKTSNLQSSGIVNEETLAALRCRPSRSSLHDHTAGCRGTVHRQDAARHDGKLEAAGAWLHLGARSARREVSQQPGADAEAESGRWMGGGRSDHSAGRGAVRAAVEGPRSVLPRRDRGDCVGCDEVARSCATPRARR